MAKKANRVAAEGIVATEVAEDGKAAAIVEVNIAETTSLRRMLISRLYVAKVAAQAA